MPSSNYPNNIRTTNITVTGVANIANLDISNLEITDLEASELVATDADKKLVSIPYEIGNVPNSIVMRDSSGTATFNTIIADGEVQGTWNGVAISAAKGGTGQTAYSVGDLLYANSANTLAKTTPSANSSLVWNGSTYVWNNIYSPNIRVAITGQINYQQINNGYTLVSGILGHNLKLVSFLIGISAAIPFTSATTPSIRIESTSGSPYAINIPYSDLTSGSALITLSSPNIGWGAGDSMNGLFGGLGTNNGIMVKVNDGTFTEGNLMGINLIYEVI